MLFGLILPAFATSPPVSRASGGGDQIQSQTVELLEGEYALLAKIGIKTSSNLHELRKGLWEAFDDYYGSGLSDLTFDKTLELVLLSAEIMGFKTTPDFSWKGAIERDIYLAEIAAKSESSPPEGVNGYKALENLFYHLVASLEGEHLEVEHNVVVQENLKTHFAYLLEQLRMNPFGSQGQNFEEIGVERMEIVTNFGLTVMSDFFPINAQDQWQDKVDQEISDLKKVVRAIIGNTVESQIVFHEIAHRYRASLTTEKRNWLNNLTTNPLTSLTPETAKYVLEKQLKAVRNKEKNLLATDGPKKQNSRPSRVISWMGDIGKSARKVARSCRSYLP